MFKTTGLEELQKQFADAQRAFKALDGQIATVKFDPNSEESIQAAIAAMEAAIDEKVRPYQSNALIQRVVPQLKEKYRAAILERAQEGKA